MSKTCCVCSEGKESKENVLFNCKGHGCDVTVHQGCYGIVTMPSGLWFCRKCESQERAARVRCELCPKKEGALKRTDQGGWAHVVCALYIPEVTFGNNRLMEPIVTSKLPKERFAKSCYICEERGKEMQSTYGACMSCHKSSCRLAFHVTCAQRERLLCEEQDSRDVRNVTYCGYCSTHHKKMMRLKNRQLKQQQSVQSSTGSSHLPTTPTSPITPLSAIPPEVSLSEEVSTRETAHALERTASGSPIKGSSKEGVSLNEVPGTYKRPPLPSSSSSTTSEVLMSSGAPHKGTKPRRRKPSSSNDSSTSEAPSNASDVPLLPPSASQHAAAPVSRLSNLSPPSLGNHLIPISPSPLGPPAKSVHHHKGRLVDEGRVGVGMAGEDVGVVKMETGLVDQDDVVGQMLEVSSHSGVASLAESKAPAAPAASEQGPRSQSQAPPPRSLQELLERQWEQTAQFILDQAGKQNNAGSMLAHLHTLQTENRQMQSRIMELASQREFYLAINTKLRQTLSEHELGRSPNGVQPVETAVHNHAAGSSHEPMEVSGLTPPTQQSYGYTPHGRHHRHQPSSLASPSPQLSNSLPREDQESLLHAHFSSSSATPLPSSREHAPRGGGRSRPSSSTRSESGASRHQPSSSHLQQQQGSVAEGGVGSHAQGSNFLSTFTQLPPQASSESLPILAPPPPSIGLAILPTSRGPVEYGNLVSGGPPAGGETSVHEVTQVTHSIQAPISSLTPLPNDSGCG